MALAEKGPRGVERLQRLEEEEDGGRKLHYLVAIGYADPDSLGFYFDAYEDDPENYRTVYIAALYLQAKQYGARLRKYFATHPEQAPRDVEDRLRQFAS